MKNPPHFSPAGNQIWNHQIPNVPIGKPHGLEFSSPYIGQKVCLVGFRDALSYVPLNFNITSKLSFTLIKTLLLDLYSFGQSRYQISERICTQTNFVMIFSSFHVHEGDRRIIQSVVIFGWEVSRMETGSSLPSRISLWSTYHRFTRCYRGLSLSIIKM